MRSKKVSFHMPWPIYDASRKLCHDEGYRSIGRYFIGLALNHAIIRKERAVITQVSNGDPEEQDELLDLLLGTSHEDLVKLLLETKKKK